MTNHIYKKKDKEKTREKIRFVGLSISILGLLLGLYIFFPLLSWEIYLKPVFASSSYASPIPKKTIISKNSIQNLISNPIVSFNNSSNWIPEQKKEVDDNKQLTSYFISIPKIGIENAIVSTVDTDLSVHLVHYPGTATPPNKGSGAIFGHSTLPQLYDPKNYKTIFANIHNVEVGDSIIVTADNTLHTYKIYDILVTEPEDTSYLVQQYEGSFLNIITCTPPGTIWKRLIIKAKMQ